jgi:hypothetical protein
MADAAACLGSGVLVCAALQQQLHALQVAILRGDVQRRSAKLAANAKQRQQRHAKRTGA